MKNNNSDNLQALKVSEAVEGINSPPEAVPTCTGGWVQTDWHQSHPYNQFCPRISGSNRCLAGSLAVAVAQIVHYRSTVTKALAFRAFSGENSYVSRQGDLEIKFFAEAEQYDFPDIETLNQKLKALDSRYKEEETISDVDLAFLIFACGVALKQNYGEHYTNTGLKNIMSPLVSQLCFKYFPILK